eukprot:TRINITY_DN232_c0_g1_i3.p1 TRINITY_DN232_c0_g1~~TRINITY_DN232_c0_g1_i3.p1  ORF type:complete len:138 (-),score=20.71 TRINITY_DN232_c0_g1_i3:118-531(-)
MTSTPTFMYSFDHVPSFANVTEPGLEWCFQACHATELPFVFPSLLPVLAGGPWNFTADEADLSLFMRKAWTSFAMTGDPNPNSAPVDVWSTFNTTTSSFIHLNTPVDQAIVMDSAFREKYCDSWAYETTLPPNLFGP